MSRSNQLTKACDRYIIFPTLEKQGQKSPLNQSTFYQMEEMFKNQQLF